MPNGLLKIVVFKHKYYTMKGNNLYISDKNLCNFMMKTKFNFVLIIIRIYKICFFCADKLKSF